MRKESSSPRRDERFSLHGFSEKLKLERASERTSRMVSSYTKNYFPVGNKLTVVSARARSPRHVTPSASPPLPEPSSPSQRAIRSSPRDDLLESHSALDRHGDSSASPKEFALPAPPPTALMQAERLYGGPSDSETCSLVLDELRAALKKLTSLGAQVLPAEGTKTFRLVGTCPAATLADRSVLSDVTREGRELLATIRDVFVGKDCLSTLGNLHDYVGPKRTPPGDGGKQGKGGGASSPRKGPPAVLPPETTTAAKALTAEEVHELDLNPQAMHAQGQRQDQHEDELSMLRGIGVFVTVRVSVDHVAVLADRCEDRLSLCRELEQRAAKNPLRFADDDDYEACLDLIKPMETAIANARAAVASIGVHAKRLWTETLERHVSMTDEYNKKAMEWNNQVLKLRTQHRSRRINNLRSLLTVMIFYAEGKLTGTTAEPFLVKVQMFEELSSVIEVVQRARELTAKYKAELCSLLNITGEPTADHLASWMVGLAAEEKKPKKRSSKKKANGDDDSDTRSLCSVRSKMSVRSSASAGSKASTACDPDDDGTSTTNFKLYKDAKVDKLPMYDCLIESVSLGLFRAVKILYEKFDASFAVDDPFVVAPMVSLPLAGLQLSYGKVSRGGFSPDQDSGSSGDDSGSDTDSGSSADSSEGSESGNPFGTIRTAAKKRNTKLVQRAVQVALEDTLEPLLRTHLYEFAKNLDPDAPIGKSAGHPKPLQPPVDTLGLLNEYAEHLGDPVAESDVEDDDGVSFYSKWDPHDNVLPYVEVGTSLSALYRQSQERCEMLKQDKDAESGPPRKKLTGRDLVVADRVANRANVKLPFWRAPVPAERPPAMPKIPTAQGLAPASATKATIRALSLSLTPLRIRPKFDGWDLSYPTTPSFRSNSTDDNASNA